AAILTFFFLCCEFARFFKRDANGVLGRQRRANSGFLEELKQGNLERECIEEICDFEEAREVFEDVDKTNQFWMTYNRRDPCEINPCANNGTCRHVDSTYECQCMEGFEGRHCQTAFEDSLKCFYLNGLCQHFCDGSGKQRRCSCAEGYKLGEDGRECVANVEFPCGQIPVSDSQVEQSTDSETRIVGANHCPKGACPWQVLVQLSGRSHCGGALIGPEWVVTAAHCLHDNQLKDITVVAGEHNLDFVEGTEQTVRVSMAISHENYTRATPDSDVALLRLERALNLSRDVIPVCLPTKDFSEHELLKARYHQVSGWGARTNGGNAFPQVGTPHSPNLRHMSVPLIPNSQCSQVSQIDFNSNMLCAGYLEGRQESCRGDDGSPLVTAFGSTHFLTGVVGWGRGCGRQGYYGVYANMANYVDWAKATIKNPPDATMQEDFTSMTQTHV
uniref:Coagulation factor VIIi n=1 Tax=Gouania willdenowi TaxID=441366 RepID=A0A8C5DEK1_GOUWI